MMMFTDWKAMDILIMLGGALAIDLILGEPPRPLHPVVWMGKFTQLWERASSGRHPAAHFAYGTIMTLLTIGLFAVPAYFILYELKDISYAAYVTLGAIILKSTFSFRELRRVAIEVKRLLLENKLAEARSRLRSLVKRDTRELSEPLVVSATIESATENTSDSFIAPLFYFLLLGVPAALAYRVINTLDAMIGYRGRYEHLGKFAARLDDVVNLVPARLTALLLVLAAFISKRDGRASWRVMLRDHARTESPNAGWPMAASAGALNVRLEKAHHYQLGEANAPLAPQTIEAAMGLVGLSALIWVIICVAVEVSKLVATS